MNTADHDWEARIAATWACVQSESLCGEALVAAIDALCAERASGDATALFERACVRDTVGVEDQAEGYYRAALATGQLDAYRSSRASIQLASTLRILGRLNESEQLLVNELNRHVQPGNLRALHDEARAILALTYVAQGRAKEAAGLALSALAPHLPRYNRSVAGNAAEMVERAWNRGTPPFSWK